MATVGLGFQAVTRFQVTLGNTVVFYPFAQVLGVVDDIIEWFHRWRSKWDVVVGKVGPTGQNMEAEPRSVVSSRPGTKGSLSGSRPGSRPGYLHLAEPSMHAPPPSVTHHQSASHILRDVFRDLYSNDEAQEVIATDLHSGCLVRLCQPCRAHSGNIGDNRVDLLPWTVSVVSVQFPGLSAAPKLSLAIASGMFVEL
jgi:hypothetical protein